MHVITAVNLRKIYRTYQKDSGLRGALRDLFRRQTIDHTAVDSVSFTISAPVVCGSLLRGRHAPRLAPTGASWESTDRPTEVLVAALRRLMTNLL